MTRWLGFLVVGVGVLGLGCGGETPGGDLPPNRNDVAAPADNRAPPDGSTPGPADTGPAWEPLEAQVEHFELTYDPAYQSTIDSGNRVYVPGKLVARGETRDVQLRKRGQASLYHPKPSFKVKLPKDNKLDGEQSLELMAEWLDAGVLTDHFSYGLMQAGQALAPRARYVTLTVNGVYQGIYTKVEAVDDELLQHHGLDKNGSLYRCGARDCELKITPPAPYQDPWEKHTNETLPWDDLDALLNGVSRTPEDQFEGWLERHVDVEQYLRRMAVEILIANYGQDDSGSYLDHDFLREKWVYIPWDLNNCQMLLYREQDMSKPIWFDQDVPVFTLYDKRSVKTYLWKDAKYGNAHVPFNVLNQRIWDRPALRNRVLDRLALLLDTVYAPAQVTARVDGQVKLVGPLYATDPYIDQPHAAVAGQYLKDFTRLRRDWLKQRIPVERTRFLGGVVINAFGLAGTDDAGEISAFVELYNGGDKTVDLSGFNFTNDLRKPFLVTLPQGLTIPSKGKVTLWADGQPEQGPTHLPFTLNAEGGELGLFDGSGPGAVVDLAYYGSLAGMREYGRVPDGSESWGAMR